MAKAFQHKVEYAIVRVLYFVLSLLPLSIALRFGDFLGFLAFSVLRIRRKVSLINLKNSFGDKYSDSQYNRIARLSFTNFARSMIEFALHPKIKRIGIENLVAAENPHTILDHLNSGKGAVIVSGHLGNFELFGAYMASISGKIDFLVGRQHNRLVNDLMNKRREIFKAGLIEIGVAARGVFNSLKKGRGVIMLSDQDTRADGVIVDFLGRAASTPKGPSAFALRTGLPIFVFAIIRESLMKHHIRIEGPFTLEKSKDKEEDIRRLTQIYTDVIGKFVTENPEQYFWAHKRWKTTFPEDYR